MWIFLKTVVSVIIISHLNEGYAFSPSINIFNSISVSSPCSTTKLSATNKGSKRRRRKNPPAVPTKDPIKTSQEKLEILDGNVVPVSDDDDDDDDETEEQLNSKADLLLLNEIANFEFQKDKEMTLGVLDAASTRDDSSIQNAIPLPDITEARRLKQEQIELQRLEQEREEKKVRIKRSDKEAFRKLLEQQPFADADDSLFEEEAYGAVSALLGERAQPFLGIPFGALQVGHFIGSLGIILMAFVEYPGFPLTNLPTPVRECLQGGLASVYVINVILAGFAVFRAKERGQETSLWVIKTLAVGGLAYDQLTQLPTLEAVEKANSVKGKRAIKNKPRF